MSNHEQIIENFMVEYPEWDVDANRQLLLDESTKPVSLQNLRVAAHRLGDRLVMASEHAQGLAEFYAAFPQFAGIRANTSVLLGLLRGDEPTLANLTECAESSQCSLAVNSAYTQAAADEKERQQLISELNRPDRAGLALEDLRGMVAQQRETARQQALPREELREELHTEQQRLNQARNQKPEWPTHFEVGVTTDYFRKGETIVLDKRAFMRLDKEDLRRLLKTYGTAAADRFLGIQPRAEVGQSIKFNL